MTMFEWICPVCNSNNAGEFPTHDVCLTCEWENDPLQEKDPTYDGGANDRCLNDYRADWQTRDVAVVASGADYVAAAV